MEKAEENKIIESLINSFKRNKLDATVRNEIKKEIEDSVSKTFIDYFYSDSYKGNRYTISFRIEKSENGDLIFGKGKLVEDA